MMYSSWRVVSQFGRSHCSHTKSNQTFDKQFASQDAIREALQVEVAKALEANGKRPALFDKLMWWKSS